MPQTPFPPDPSQLDAYIRHGLAAEDPPPPSYDVAARVAEVVAYGVQRPQLSKLAQQSQRSLEGNPAERSRSNSHRGLSNRSTGIVWGVVGAFAACSVIFGVFQYNARTAFTSVGSPVVVSTGQGHQSTVQLPDGSQVHLAPASRVRYSTAYGVKSREIDLEGQAVFTVTSSSDAPFIVRARGTETRVLGTKFDIRAYDSDSVVRVAVAQGRVRIGTSDVLSVGDVVQVADDGSVRRVNGVTVADLMSWTHNKLTFKDKKLSVVARELERWYDVDITIADPSVANTMVTAQFENIDLTMALEILSRSLGLTYQRQEKQITITSSR